MLRTIIKIVSITTVILTVLILIFHFFFFWMNLHMDSYFFTAFTDFIRTGKYVFPISSLHYTHIHTGQPPLYSLLLAILYSFKRSDTILHAIQILMLGSTGILVFQILRNVLSKYLAAIAACLLVLIPGNLIFVAMTMSETGAELLFTLYCFLVFLYFKSKKYQFLSLSVFVGFITGLWKYSFVYTGVLSLLYLFMKHPKKATNYIWAFLGVGTIFIWVLINHHLTGVWGLDLGTGIRFNIQMMYKAKVLPKETAPSMVELRKYMEPGVDLKKAYWDIEPYMIPYIGYDYLKMTKLIGDVGWDAMLEHPLDYAKVTAESFFLSNIGLPYQPTLGTFGMNKALDYPGLLCGNTGTIEHCIPIISTKYSYTIWNTFIDFANLYYNYFFTIFIFAVFFPALLWSVFSSSAIHKIFSLIYILGRLSISLATEPMPRYIVPFYPLMVIIIGFAMADMFQKIRKVKIFRKDGYLSIKV
jgi:hypothetical protein